MRFSVDWLGDHVDLSGKTPTELGELFTLHVAEVDRVEESWPGVSVAAVTAVRPHPNADKLRLVSLATGDGAIEVVCGAPNVAEGQKICFAPAGVTLPGGLLLKKTKIRGVESGGMVLSERELGLSDEHEGILVLETDAPVGTPAAAVLPGAGAVIDVDNHGITNRPDLWGHYGAAREFAAVLERPLKKLDLGDEFEDAPGPLAVDVQVPELCPRYLGWVIGGIEVGPSPAWLQQRLEAAGQRSINNVVDLTNYIQLECGQPLHAFDRRQIAQGKIIVRAAREGEKVTTLDGVERTLPTGACVIADPERAVAIAGVMGLENSEVQHDTSEIVLEVANFAPTWIRSTSKALGLRTESASRFEKGVDPQAVPVAARRFLRLLRELCPDAAPVGGPCDVRELAVSERRVRMPESFIGERLGASIAPATVDAILGRLGFETERYDATLVVSVPSWRRGNDIALPEDIVEEVGRIHGYDKLAPQPLVARLDPVPDEPLRSARAVAHRALALVAGFTEAHFYPFTTADDCARAGIEPGTLQLANAEQPGLDLMTGSNVPTMLKTVAENAKYRDEVALYVVAPVFEAGVDGALPRENQRVTMALAQRSGTPVLELKGAVEALLDCFRARGVRTMQQEGPPWLHPGRCARVGRGREAFGWFGEVHPAVARAFDIDVATAVADLDLDALNAARGGEARMQRIGRYPTVPYDVAVLVDRRTPAGDVAGALESVDRTLVLGVRLFDVYEGKNLPADKKSLAFTILFGSLDRTLDTDDVERLRAAVGRIIEKRGWALRV